jgi:hypothetical protein
MTLNQENQEVNHVVRMWTSLTLVVIQQAARRIAIRR